MTITRHWLRFWRNGPGIAWKPHALRPLEERLMAQGRFLRGGAGDLRPGLQRRPHGREDRPSTAASVWAQEGTGGLT
jgi:hypothetical protein